jgi:hypothetical protein
VARRRAHHQIASSLLPLSKTSIGQFFHLLLFSCSLGGLISRNYITETGWRESGRVTSRIMDTQVRPIRSKLGVVSHHGWELKAV